MRVRGEGIAEEHHGADIALGDAGSDLEIASRRSAGAALDRQPQVVDQALTRGPRRDQIDPTHDVDVLPRQRDDVVLLPVVRDQREPQRSLSRSDPCDVSHATTIPSQRYGSGCRL